MRVGEVDVDVERDPKRSVVEALIGFAEATPDRLALRASGSELDFSGLYREVARTAGFFANAGVAAGSRVAIYSEVDRDVVVAMLALFGLGATAVPLSVAQPPDSLAQMLAAVAPERLVHSRGSEPPSGLGVETLVLESAGAPEAPLVHPSPESLAIILFTSGSSGVPKAVPLTHASVHRNAWTTAELLGVRPDDRILINTPPYTTSSIAHVLTMLSHGAGTVIERGIQFGANLLDQIVEHDCSGFGGVPVHFSRLLAACDESVEPGRLRFLMNSGDHLPTPVLLGLQERLPELRIFCVYGLTEVAGRLCLLDPAALPEKNGSVGRPLPGMEVRVRDADGRELPAGEVGEVYVTGVNLMTGYLDAPAANAKSLTPHGFATGDVGHLDADGCLYLHGRHDDLIKVGAEKVSLKVIESAIEAESPFADFMVGAVDDEHLGPLPCVFYVAQPGEPFRKAELLRALKRKLPKTHVPRLFNEVDVIPRTASGKAIRPKPFRGPSPS